MEDDLFVLLLNELEKLELIVNEGKIKDTSFVEVPCQCNNREKNKQIKICLIHNILNTKRLQNQSKNLSLQK